MHNILGINPFHNGSVCILSDGELIFYQEEERLTRSKYDEYPFQTLIYILDNFPIHDIVTTGINIAKKMAVSPFVKEPFEHLILRKLGFNNLTQIIDFSENHHLTHVASSFYNSGFSEAIGIVIDAGGSNLGDSNENDSIYVCSYPMSFEILFQNRSTLISQSNGLTLSDLSLNIGQSFEQLSLSLGFHALAGGKIMGLSSYGSNNPKIPNLFDGNRTNLKYVNEEISFRNFIPKDYSTEWHNDSNLITDLEKDISWKLQKESQEIVGNYVDQAIKVTNLNKVVMSGGFGLNCVANYYLKKRFPNVEFYFDPLPYDGGTAIGAAKLLHHNTTQDTTIRPHKTLYCGPQYTKEQIIKGINKYLD